MADGRTLELTDSYEVEKDGTSGNYKLVRKYKSNIADRTQFLTFI